MDKLRSLGIGVVIALAVPASAFAVVLDSNFFGHAVSSAPDPPSVYTVGESYTARLILDEIPVGAGDGPWYPWNATQEYTVVINATVASYTGGAVWFVTFAPGATVDIYEDNGTAAVFATPSTFTDGTLILTGSSADLAGFGTSTSLGNIYGTFDFTGGAGLSQCACTVPTVTLNDFVDTMSSPPASYDENYDAKWDCAGTVTSVENETWGRVKALYR